MNIVLGVLACYLVGAIPFSVLFSRLLLNSDVRKHGSGNPGTSNMARAFGVPAGLLVLLFDMGKGYLAVLIGQALMGPAGLYFGAMFAIVGHNWPIYLKFKGGKGVAATMGVMLAFAPYLTIIAMVVFVLTLLITRYFSVASLTSLCLLWLLVLIVHFAFWPLVLLCTVLVALAFAQHQPNIKRLKNGTENKFMAGQSKAK